MRIELSEKNDGCADLFLMNDGTRIIDIAIAHLPMDGEPSQATITAAEHWPMILDVLAEINGRAGRPEAVTVETSNGDKWEHAA